MCTTLTFDLGQSGFRARVTRPGGEAVDLSGEGYRLGASTDDLLVTIVERAAQASGATRFDRIAGGVTGVHGRVGDVSAVAARLHESWGTARLIVADDAVTSYLGARGTGPGVVAAIGTGLVVLGRGADGAYARVDGLGPMTGDEGAGWWLGRQGLIAALSVADGREGSSQALFDAAAEEYGTTDASLTIAHSPAPIAEVARFARRVVETARHGDPVAADIVTRAAQHIANAVVAAALRTHLVAPLSYTLVGGIARAADLLDPPLQRYVAERLGEGVRDEAEGTSLDGAQLLFDEPDGALTAPLVVRAEFDREHGL